MFRLIMIFIIKNKILLFFEMLFILFLKYFFFFFKLDGIIRFNK
jgi:hypothetical protein